MKKEDDCYVMTSKCLMSPVILSGSLDYKAAIKQSIRKIRWVLHVIFYNDLDEK